MLNHLKKIQEDVDKQSFFIYGKMYEEITKEQMLRHNCLHLVNLIGKISAVCEQEEHGNSVSSKRIVNEVIPDLIIYALQFSNMYDVDLDKKYEERLKFVLNKYSPNSLPFRNKVVNTIIETKSGPFNMYVWKSLFGQEPIAMVTPNFDPKKPVLLRIHSECITGDNFGSKKCDCGEQKENALKMIKEHGNGMLIYHRQEGRGIGLFEKIKTYQLQGKGVDTYDANVQLGHKPDARTYIGVKKILEFLEVTKVDLITNNPLKVKELETFGIIVNNQISSVTIPNEHNIDYLKTKIHKFGHAISL